MIIFLRDAGRLRPELDQGTAQDIFWMFTGRDVYRMLVHWWLHLFRSEAARVPA
jgi:hypothetical protein